MHRKTLIAAALSAVLALGAVPAMAQDEPVQIYGADLMTDQEKQDYLRELKACRNAEELSAFRLEHYRKIAERARARGATLADWAGYTRGEGGVIFGLGDIVYGWRFMSDAERAAYIDKLRALPTAEEQLKFMVEHHAQMMERAKQQRAPLAETSDPYGYQIYGADLMTPDEIAQYRQKLAGLKTEQERERFYREHFRTIQARARQQLAGIADWGGNSMTGAGIGLGDMIYSWRLMSEDEYRKNVDKLRALPTAEDQIRFIVDLHKEMQARARAQGIRLPDVPAPFWYFAAEKGN
ncbi:MAG: hypothetical protein AB1713_08340 [Pseudomonadota bacterium]